MVAVSQYPAVWSPMLRLRRGAQRGQYGRRNRITAHVLTRRVAREDAGTPSAPRCMPGSRFR